MSGPKIPILTVRIWMESSGNTKVLKFPADIPVHSVIKDLEEKVSKQEKVGRDHGLFIVPIVRDTSSGQVKAQVSIAGRWMERSRSLKHYKIVNDQLLEYKKRHRPLTVKFIDGTENTFLVDNSATVRKIVGTISGLLELGKDGDQFCLAYPNSKITKPEWLEEVGTLHSQSRRIEEKEGPLLFWKRYFSHDSSISTIENQFLVNIYYVQTNLQLLAGMFPMGRIDARKFGALQLQISLGNYNSSVHIPGWIPPTNYLPQAFATDKKLVVDVLSEWSKLKDTKKESAQNRYIQLARAMKTYGMSFFHFTETSVVHPDASKKSKKQKTVTREVVLSVSAEGLAYYEPTTNQFTEEIPYVKIRNYSYLDSTLTLFQRGKEPIKLQSKDAGEVFDMISGYIAIILRERQDAAKKVDDDSGSIAEMEDDEVQWFNTESSQAFPVFHNPRNFNYFGQNLDPFLQAQMAQQETLTMYNHVKTLDEAMKGMSAVTEHIASGKGAWGKKKSDLEWRRDLDQSSKFLSPILEDFIDECQSDDRNKKMLDIFARNIYVNALNISQSALHLKENLDDSSALLGGAVAVADSLAAIMAICDKNSVLSPELQQACIDHNLAALALLKNPEGLKTIDTGSKYLLDCCLYDIDNKINVILTESQKNPQLETVAKEAFDIKNLALKTLASLIPYSDDEELDIHIMKAKEAIQNSMKKVALEDSYEDLQTSLGLFEASRKIRERTKILGNIDICTPANEFLTSLAVFRAELISGDAGIYSALGKCQNVGKNSLLNVIHTLTLQTEGRVSERLGKMETMISNDLEELSVLTKTYLSNAHSLQQASKVGILEMVGKLEEQAQLLTTDVGVLTTLNNVRYHSKKMIADLVNMVTVTYASLGYIEETKKNNLVSAGKVVSPLLENLLQSLKVATEEPNNILIQNQLLAAVQKDLPAYEQFINSALETKFIDAPSTEEKASERAKYDAVHKKFEESTKETKETINELKKAVKRMLALEGNVLISQALMEIEMIKATVDNAELTATFSQLPVDNRLDANMASKRVNRAFENFLTAVGELVLISNDTDGEDSIPEYIMATVDTLEKLVTTQHVLAGLTHDKKLQTQILGISKLVVETTINLIAVSRVIAEGGENLELAKESQKVLHEKLIALSTTFGDSEDEDVKLLLDGLEKNVFRINMAPLQSASKTQNIVEQQLIYFVKALEVSLDQMVTSALRTSNQSRAPLSVACGITVDILDCLAYHPKVNDKVKNQIKDFYESMVNLFKATAETNRVRTQESLNELIRLQEIPIPTLRLILAELMGTTHNEILHSNVFQIIQTATDLESGRVNLYPCLKSELSHDISKNVSELNKILFPLTKINELLKDGNNELLVSQMANISEEAKDKCIQILTAAHVAKKSDGRTPVMSVAGMRLLQGCDIILKNYTQLNAVDACVGQFPSIIAELIENTKKTVSEDKDLVQRKLNIERLKRVIDSSKLLLEASKNPTDQLTLVHLCEDLKRKIINLEYSLYPVSTIRIDNVNNPNSPTFTPEEASRLCEVAKTVVTNAGMLLQSTYLLTNFCPNSSSLPKLSEDHPNEFNKYLQVSNDLQKNIKNISIICGADDKEKEQSINTLESIQRQCARLVAGINNASFDYQITTLPESYDRLTSEIPKTTQIGAQEFIQNIRTLLEAYKTQDASKILPLLEHIETSIEKFVDNILITAEGFQDKEQKLQLLNPASIFAFHLIALLKSVDRCDIDAPGSFQTVAKSAVPCIEGIKNCIAFLTKLNTDRLNELNERNLEEERQKQAELELQKKNKLSEDFCRGNIVKLIELDVDYGNNDSKPTGTSIKPQTAQQIAKLVQAKLDAISKGQKPAPKENAQPEMLSATCQLILDFAGNSLYLDSLSIDQDVNTLPNLIDDILSCCLGLVDQDDALMEDFLKAARGLGDSLCGFLNSSATAPRDKYGLISQQNLDGDLRKVIGATSELVGLTKKIGANDGELAVENKTIDIEEQTEDELNRCAQIINDAVKLLSTVQQPAKKTTVGLSSEDISEAILEAARSMGLGTADLIRAAAVVQGERKEAKQNNESKYNADPAWANGLISAAQGVAENVKMLVDAANATAKGESEEERLIAAAKAVSAVTVQLLQASRTKAEDLTATSQKNLSKAATNVQLSSGQLVVAAQACQEFKDKSAEPEDYSNVDFTSAWGIRAQMEQASKIEKLEKELRDAHQELIKLRRARYQVKPVVK